MKKTRVLAIVLFVSTIAGCLPATPGSSPAEKMPFWARGAGSIEERFELAKRSTPELVMFLRRMPKGGDLHNHLTGATYSSYILESAKQRNLNYDLRTNRFTKAPPEKGAVVSVGTLVSNPDYLGQYLDTFSMRGWHKNTQNGHDHFFRVFSRIHSSERSHADMLAEVAARNIYENVQYIELMTSCVPQQVITSLGQAVRKFDINDLQAAFDSVGPLLNDKSIHGQIRQYLDDRERLADKTLEAKHGWRMTGKNPDIVVRFIPELFRETSRLDEFFIYAVASILAIHADDRVVALNIVGAEDDPLSAQYFGDQMAILDFLWRKMGQPKFALHAGELVLKESPAEPMSDRISRTIDKGHALRIGHGVSIAWERDVVAVLDKMKKKGIMVEICLSSNEGILGVKGKDHPFILYRRAGVPVSINTDDEGISRSNLTMEYVKAVQRYDLTYRDLKKLVHDSIRYSFLSETEKKGMLQKVDDAFVKFEDFVLTGFMD